MKPRLSHNGTRMTWTLEVPMPECPHPIEHQVVTAEGTECSVCGWLQPVDDERQDVDA